MIKYEIQKFFKSKLNIATVALGSAFVLFALLSKLHYIFSYLSICTLGVAIIIVGVIVQKKHKQTKYKLLETLQNERNPKKIKNLKRKHLLPLKLSFLMLYLVGAFFIYHVINLVAQV